LYKIIIVFYTMYKPPHQKPKNTFIQSQKKVAALDDAIAFPELTAKLTVQPKNHAVNEVTKPQLDFKAKLETAQVAEAKKPEPVTTKQKRWATPDEIMSRLNDNYLRWKEEYIEEYGEEYYERYYRFPNYDYEYFDKLDEKLERELELEEMKEREKEQEEDFVTDDYEEYEKE
jgi:hypothetical protein